MYLDDSAISCGVMQYHGLNHKPKLILEYLASDSEASGKPFIMFSDVVKKRSGNGRLRKTIGGIALATFIKKHKLGKLTVSGDVKNITGNVIRVWVFQPNWDRMAAYDQYNEFGNPKNA